MCEIEFCKNSVKFGSICKKHKEFLYKKTTKMGFLVYSYKNLKYKNKHCYGNKYLMSRDLFIKWSLTSPKFNEVFSLFVANRFSKKFSPTISRYNQNKGFTLENVEWLSFFEKSRLTALKRIKA